MAHLLPALTPAKFDNQREVVLNERRQNYENRPYGLATMATVAALFPPDHPYSWLTIGSADDLRASTLDEARTFFETFYHPGNASLAIAGDINVEEAIDLVGAYFGDVPAGPGVGPVRREPQLAGPVRLLHQDRVELPRLYLAWHSPAMFAPGDAELDLIADVLTNGKNSRLYHCLVYTRRIATEVAAFQNSRELASFFQVIVTAAPGHTLAEIEQVVLEEIASLAATGPTEDELERSLAQAEAQFVYRLQTVGGFGGKSDQLNAYTVFLGEPGYFDRDLARYQQASVASLRDHVQRYLVTDRRVTLSVVPQGSTDLAIVGSEPVVVR
jgi:zinc protease